MRLGECYAAGKGLPQDARKAYFWLTLADNHEQKDAAKLRAKVRPKLSSDDLSQVERSIAEWKPKPAPIRDPAIVR